VAVAAAVVRDTRTAVEEVLATPAAVPLAVTALMTLASPAAVQEQLAETARVTVCE
jgi:hypothetical protein